MMTLRQQMIYLIQIHSSTKSSDIRNNKGIIDNQQEKQNTVTKIAYGECDYTDN